MRRFVPVFLAFTLWMQFMLPLAQDASAADNPVPEHFALGMFNLATRGQTSNVVISPYSISTALSMTYNGAAGKTKDEMQNTLGLAGLTDEAINQNSATLAANLVKVNPVSQLNIANALFAKQGITFKQPFIQTNQKYYGAKLETLDFGDPATIQKINGWVNEQTKGKIKTILDKIPADAFLYLINAIYFKGTWLKQFDEAATKPADFTLLNQAKKNVPMMDKDGDFLYLRGSNFQAVMLPYQDKRLHMCIFLPDEKVDYEAFTASFVPDNWQKWMSEFKKHAGHLGLPRFRIEYSTELSKILKEAGMPCAFLDSCADFSAMVSDPAIISRVLHKTFLEVNEKGTEAAAVTAVEMSLTMAPMDPEPPFNMVCNRPFVIAIRDSETGAILFLGSIVDPTS